MRKRQNQPNIVAILERDAFIEAAGGLRQITKGGRESFVPNSLLFKRKSGVLYVQTGLSISGMSTVKSLATGTTVEMDAIELSKFKNS